MDRKCLVVSNRLQLRLTNRLLARLPRKNRRITNCRRPTQSIRHSPSTPQQYHAAKSHLILRSSSTCAVCYPPLFQMHRMMREGNMDTRLAAPARHFPASARVPRPWAAAAALLRRSPALQRFPAAPEASYRPIPAADGAHKRRGGAESAERAPRQGRRAAAAVLGPREGPRGRQGGVDLVEPLASSRMSQFPAPNEPFCRHESTIYQQIFPAQIPPRRLPGASTAARARPGGSSTSSASSVRDPAAFPSSYALDRLFPPAARTSQVYDETVKVCGAHEEAH